MIAHPLQLTVERPARRARVHVLVRLLFSCALGAVGWASLCWLLYFVGPAVVALELSSKGANAFFSRDGAAATRALRWLAAAYAYLFGLTDAPPSTAHVELTLETGGTPTPGSALLRLFTSLPALLVVALLSMVASVVWLIGAVAILLVEDAPAFVDEFMTSFLRYQLRFFAYHLSLVERYPMTAPAPAATAQAA